MRIIAGEHRGRALTPPPGEQEEQRGEGVTRPITDRAKQSLFDVISPWLTEEAVVADVFAGTGSMGLECLSRGATTAPFYEADRGALGGLRENIAKLRLGDRAKVVAGDLFKLFEASPPPPGSLDVVFLDPPYKFLVEKPEMLRRLAGQVVAALKDDGVVSFRHGSEDRLALPGLKVGRELTYGSMTIELLRKG